MGNIASNDRARAKRCLAKGFTLIEVLVAVTVMAVGILGVMGAFSLSLQTASRTTHSSEAVAIAQRELELATSAQIDRLEEKSGTSGRYTWQLSFDQKPQGLMLASVLVQWSDRGRLREFRLSQVFLPRKADA